MYSAEPLPHFVDEYLAYLYEINPTTATFDGVHVGPDALIGRPGAGMAIFTHSMDWERSCILAPSVGSMQRQVDQAVEYA